MREWTHDKHVIGPVKAYAVLVARLVWQQFIAGSHAVFHLENYDAMDVYIKGTSTNAQIRRILLPLRRRSACAILGRVLAEFLLGATAQTIHQSPFRLKSCFHFGVG